MSVAVCDQEHLPPFRGTVSLALVDQTQLPLPLLLLLLLLVTWAALWLWCHPANVTLLLLLMQQPLTFTLASHGARLVFVLEFSNPDHPMTPTPTKGWWWWCGKQKCVSWSAAFTRTGFCWARILHNPPVSYSCGRLCSHRGLAQNIHSLVLTPTETQPRTWVSCWMLTMTGDLCWALWYSLYL